MGKETLIAKNITREGPGLIEEILGERGFPYQIVDLSRGEGFPPRDSFDILIVLGGPDSANDQTPKMEKELEAIRGAIESGKPYLGICLGLQVMVKAAGGEVIKGRVREVGFRDQADNFNTISLTETGREDPLFTGLRDTFKVFHLHGETVNLTPEMKLLGTGHNVPNQIVKIGQNAYGIQCHFELTPEMLETWLSEDDDLQSADQTGIRKDFLSVQEEYTRAGKKIIGNFLDIASGASIDSWKSTRYS